MKKMHSLLTTAAAMAAFCVGVGVAQPVDAATITLSTRFSADGPQGSALAYKTLIDGLTGSPPTAGYCDTVLDIYGGIASNQGSCGSPVNTNIAYHFQVTFDVSAANAGLWDFRFGVDFGNGGAAFVDGVAIDYRATDMYWGNMYTNPTQYLAGSALLAAGVHVLDVYGLENGLDGVQQGQYRVPGGQFTTFAVPAPGTLALLGFGLAGLARVRRRAA